MTPSRIRILATLCAALLVPSALHANDAQVVFSLAGESAGEQLGPLSFVGDLTGDGRPEFAVAAPSADSETAQQIGRVAVLDGADFQTLWTYEGSVAFGRAGRSLAPLGDVDGDGLGDLAVGVPGTGSPTLVGRVVVLSGADGSVLATHIGGGPGGHFGWSVAGMPDVDDNGRAELMVGAPHDDVGGENTGSAFILDPLDGTIHHEEHGDVGDTLGSAVTGGAGDLAARPWAMDTPTPTIGWTGGPSLALDWAYDAHPVFGAAEEGGSARGHARQLDLTTGLSFELRAGVADDDRYASALAEIGDLDGDGVSELLVLTDPRTTPGQPAAAGYTEVIDRTTALIERMEHGLIVGNNFGMSGAGPGDVDGDGMPDYVIAEPLDDTVADDAGRVVVFSGADHSVLAELYGAEAGEHFGRHLAALGDVNGDGLADFGVGSPGHDGGHGRIDVVSLTPWADAAAGLVGEAGVPSLRGHGGLVGKRDVSLVMEGAAAFADVTLVYGTELVDDGQGGLVPKAEVVVTQLQTDAHGRLVHTFEWPEGVASDTTTWFQFQVADATAAGGVARSDVIAGTTR